MHNEIMQNCSSALKTSMMFTHGRYAVGLVAHLENFRDCLTQRTNTEVLVLLPVRVRFTVPPGNKQNQKHTENKNCNNFLDYLIAVGSSFMWTRKTELLSRPNGKVGQTWSTESDYPNGPEYYKKTFSCYMFVHICTF